MLGARAAQGSGRGNHRGLSSSPGSA